MVVTVAWQRSGKPYGMRAPYPDPPGWSLVIFSTSQEWSGSPGVTRCGNVAGALAVRIVGNRTPVEPVPLYKFISALLQ